MRPRHFVSGIVLLLLGVTTRPDAAPQAAADQQPNWQPLPLGKNLTSWKRVVLPPEEKLNPKNPWSVAADGTTLVCDGVGVKEMLLYDREFGDGIFHVEWRFRKTDAKFGYNGGAYVRTSADGKVWHQAQIAHLEKPPFVADLFGETRRGGELKKFQVLGTGHKLAKPVGEWNTFAIECRGKTLTVRVNGNVATTWNECEVPRGRVGLQAEFFFVEFRNLKFAPLP